MLRLLVIVATATAYPQYYYNQPYYGMPLQPMHYPAPLGRADPYLQEEQTARYLINFQAFQRIQGIFQTDGADQVLTGSASFYQNPFTGSNSKYRVDITGMTAGDAYSMGLQTDCLMATTMAKELKKGTAPGIQLFNTFKLYGQLDDYNIDGAGGNTRIDPNYLVVRETDSTGKVIGCTAAKLQ